MSDRNNARRREMGVKDRTPAILAYSITGVLWGAVRNDVCRDPYQRKGRVVRDGGSLGTAWTV